MKNFSIFHQVFFATLLISGLALAHSGATGIVKERMDAMGEIAKSMKIIAKMVKGESSFDAEQSRLAAKTIETHSREVLNLFPEGSIHGPSEARPEIWTDWETFSQIAKEMETSASTIAENASSLNAIKPHFIALSKTCSSCHEKFRLKK